MNISAIFSIRVARSRSTDDYSPGKIPFVTNTELNNGVVRYVEPFDDDKVFSGPCICISGLGHATVHFGDFLPKGNGGDACTILTPHDDLDKAQILYYAALFNTLHGWRFSFGRKASKRRIERLALAPTHTQCPLDLGAEIEANNTMMSRLLQEKEEQLQ